MCHCSAAKVVEIDENHKHKRKRDHTAHFRSRRLGCWLSSLDVYNLPRGTFEKVELAVNPTFAGRQCLSSACYNGVTSTTKKMESIMKTLKSSKRTLPLVMDSLGRLLAGLYSLPQRLMWQPPKMASMCSSRLKARDKYSKKLLNLRQSFLYCRYANCRMGHQFPVWKNVPA